MANKVQLAAPANMGNQITSIMASVLLMPHQRSGRILSFSGTRYSSFGVNYASGFGGLPEIGPLEAKSRRISGMLSRGIFETALDNLIEDPGVFGLAYLSREVFYHLNSTGTFETLNQQNVYVRDDRYWNVFPFC